MDTENRTGSHVGSFQSRRLQGFTTEDLIEEGEIEDNDPFWNASAPAFESKPSLSQATLDLLTEIQTMAKAVLAHPGEVELLPEKQKTWHNVFSNNTFVYNEASRSGMTAFWDMLASSKRPKETHEHHHYYQQQGKSSTSANNKKQDRKEEESEEDKKDKGPSTGSILGGLAGLGIAIYGMFSLGKTDGEKDLYDSLQRRCKQSRFTEENENEYKIHIEAVVQKAGKIFNDHAKQLQQRRYVLISLVAGGIITFLGGTGLTHFILDRSKTFKAGLLVIAGGGLFGAYHWGNSRVIDADRKRQSQMLVNGTSKLLRDLQRQTTF